MDGEDADVAGVSAHIQQGACDRLASRDAKLSEVISTFDEKMAASAALIVRQRMVCGDAADVAIGVAGEVIFIYCTYR